MSNLFTCPDCKTEVSKTAKACPKCGNNKIQKQIETEIMNEAWKNMSPKAKKSSFYTLIGFFVIIAIFILYNVLDDSWKKPYDGQECSTWGYKYKFFENGNLEIWEQGSEYWDISCRCSGKWKINNDIITIKVYRNSNCPWMRKFNGNKLEFKKKNGTVYLDNLSQ